MASSTATRLTAVATKSVVVVVVTGTRIVVVVVNFIKHQNRAITGERVAARVVTATRLVGVVTETGIIIITAVERDECDIAMYSYVK